MIWFYMHLREENRILAIVLLLPLGSGDPNAGQTSNSSVKACSIFSALIFNVLTTGQNMSAWMGFRLV